MYDAIGQKACMPRGALRPPKLRACCGEVSIQPGIVHQLQIWGCILGLDAISVTDSQVNFSYHICDCSWRRAGSRQA